MKKLIAAAVAASMSAVATADVSITGNANYEYFHKTDGGATEITTNYGDMEVNLSVVGKSGDTSVVANFEVDEAGTAAAGVGIDVEDLYIATKVGDVNVKAGDFASGTTALGGEIDDGRRATNKIDLSTTIGGAKVGYATSESGGHFNNDGSAVYASIPVAGMTLGIKDQSDTYTLVGLTGEMNGINFRVENMDKDAANSDSLFYQVGTKFGDLSVSVEGIDSDTSELVEEDDSSIFAQEMGSTASGDDTGKDGVDGVSQITLATSVDGTAVKFRSGTLHGLAGKQDADFFRIEASRPLASGATLTVSYDDYEDAGVATSSTKYDTQLLEIDLAVKF
jgi:hypothetical protein